MRLKDIHQIGVFHIHLFMRVNLPAIALWFGFHMNDAINLASVLQVFVYLIGHAQYINILTCPQGFQDKIAISFNLFCPS